VPHFLETDFLPEGKLFADRLNGIRERASVRRQTLAARTAAAAVLVEAEHNEPWVVWCGLNDEADRITEMIPGAVNVEGKQTPDQKADAIERFVTGGIRVMVSKVGIAGFGLNMQHCCRMVFCGMGDSYEQYYQAIRRCWRFGQRREVRAHIVLTEPERVVFENVLAKEREAQQLASSLLGNVKEFEAEELRIEWHRNNYRSGKPVQLPGWLARNPGNGTFLEQGSEAR
jgi:superfamily II DNA or RNA helicase